jgi:hypothetical protein
MSLARARAGAGGQSEQRDHTSELQDSQHQGLRVTHQHPRTGLFGGGAHSQENGDATTVKERQPGQVQLEHVRDLIGQDLK